MEVSEYFKNNRDSKIRNSDLDKEDSNGIMSENNKWSDGDWRKSPNQRVWRDNKSNAAKPSEDRSVWRSETNKNKSNWNDRDKNNRNRNRNERSDNWSRTRNRDQEHDRNEKDKIREKYRPVNPYNPNMYDLSIPITEKQTEPQSKLEEITEEPTKTELILKNEKPEPVEVQKANGWRPKKIDTSTPEGLMQQNIRMAQGYLNKMTQVTFEPLSEKFVEIAVTENGNPPLPGQLKLLIDRIFEQALVQPTFCPMYSLLCEKIHKKMKNFRMVLLNKCQEEFELGTKDPHNSMDQVEKDDFKFKAKKRMLGNIKFIAELFKTSVIVEPVMYECFNHLLKGQTLENPDEEQIEAACKLMLNVGKILDPNKNNKRIDGYIYNLKDIQAGNLSARIRFMIDDVIDVRNNDWISLR